MNQRKLATLSGGLMLLLEISMGTFTRRAH